MRLTLTILLLPFSVPYCSPTSLGIIPECFLAWRIYLTPRNATRPSLIFSYHPLHCDLTCSRIIIPPILLQTPWQSWPLHLLTVTSDAFFYADFLASSNTHPFPLNNVTISPALTSLSSSFCPSSPFRKSLLQRLIDSFNCLPHIYVYLISRSVSPHCSRDGSVLILSEYNYFHLH